MPAVCAPGWLCIIHHRHQDDPGSTGNYIRSEAKQGLLRKCEGLVAKPAISCSLPSFQYARDPAFIPGKWILSTSTAILAWTPAVTCSLLPASVLPCRLLSRWQPEFFEKNQSPSSPAETLPRLPAVLEIKSRPLPEMQAPKYPDKS